MALPNTETILGEYENRKQRVVDAKPMKKVDWGRQNSFYRKKCYIKHVMDIAIFASSKFFPTRSTCLAARAQGLGQSGSGRKTAEDGEPSLVGGRMGGEGGEAMLACERPRPRIA